MRIVSLIPSATEILFAVGAGDEVTGDTFECDYPDEARQLTGRLRRRLASVAETVEGLGRPRVAVLEWTDPPFSSGHWVPDMVVAAGGRAVLGRAGRRSAEVTWDAVAGTGADIIVVAPCGYRLEGARELAEQLIRSGHLPTGAPVWAVDADACFVRPGPRLVDGIEALAAVIHPGALPLPEGVAVRIDG